MSACEVRFHEIVPAACIVHAYDPWRDDVLLSVSLVAGELPPVEGGGRGRLVARGVPSCSLRDGSRSPDDRPAAA